MDERAMTLARRIAAVGLPDVPVPDTVAPSDTMWRSLFGLIQDERITGLAIESVAEGWLDLTDEQIDQLMGVHRDAMMWALLIERKLLGLAGEFERDGIGFVVIKGASVARTAYPEPCLRSFGDLDLLVSTADYGRACALLGRLGHERQRPEPRPGFEVRFGKASVHRHPEDRIEVDLHRTLVLGPFGLWIDPEELLDRRQTFDLAGTKIGRLDDTGMLVNVAMHASLGRSEARLVPLRDVAQLVNGGRVDWDVLDSWARRWHLTAVLRDAFSTASRILGAAEPVVARPFLASEAPGSEIRVLHAYQGERRFLGGTSLSTIRAIPGLGNKAAYVWALAVPDRAFLLARSAGTGKATYRRRWSIPMRWTRSRIKRSTERIRGRSGAGRRGA
jgi:hypothetical protein